MRVNVKLLRNCHKPKKQNYTFIGGKLVSRSVVIDSHQVPWAAEAWPGAVKFTI